MLRLTLPIAATLLVLLAVRWSQPDALRVDGLGPLAAVAALTAGGATLTLGLARLAFARTPPWIRGFLSTAVAFVLLASFTGGPGVVAVVGGLLMTPAVLLPLLRGGGRALRAEPFPPDVLGVARLAARFAVPATWYLAAVEVVPGVQAAQRWPGLLLGGLVAGATLVGGAVLAWTRPWHACVTPLPADDRELVAYGGLGHLVGVGDPVAGEQLRVMGVGGVLIELSGLLPAPVPDALRRTLDRLTPGLVRAVCAVGTPGRVLLASAGYGDAVHLWEPGTGRAVHALAGHRGPVNALCAVPVGDTVLLASGGDDCRILLWEPETGRRVRVVGRDARWAVRALCTVPVGDRVLLAAGHADGGVRLWDPADGALVRLLGTQRGGVHAVCAVTDDDAVRLASAAGDGTVVLWDPDSGARLGSFADDAPRYALCALRMDGEVLLAAAGDGVGITVWDPATGTRRGSLGTGSGSLLSMLVNSSGWIRSMCQVGDGDDARLLLAGYDRAVEQIRLRPALRSLTTAPGEPG
ncbi:WD40 repeat domain-containing protein [Micromonospora sp. DT233]|uniref:WD40 repeat domain-containing protein n=1 Tax=Micromonospora sp. DT233 TaxID=3393432 RepID=UPI003CE9D207